MALYYIAIVAPETINRQVLEWKHYMLEHFKCKAALRSPAHITLIPPFNMTQAQEKEVADVLGPFAEHQPSFPVQLKGFGSFAPKVIYVDVQPNIAMEQSRRHLEEVLLEGGRFSVKREERAFHPHVTLANRDLEKKDFPGAWAFFRNRKYEASFRANALSLLRLAKDGWEIAADFPFMRSISG